MSFWHNIEHITSLIFPLRKESVYFKNWSVSIYRQNLPPCIQNPAHTTALFSYKHKDVRTLIRSIKKEKAVFIRDPLAEMLSEEILAPYAESAIASSNIVYVVPIPLSRKRLRERGFNQSGWIAKKVAENLGDGFMYAPYFLRKTRETKKQALLQRSKRLTNLQNSFKASKIPPGCHVILIDDVVTTGATIHEARTTLIHAGARKVTALCIAH